MTCSFRVSGYYRVYAPSVSTGCISVTISDCTVFIHGTNAQIRRFAEDLLRVVPAEAEVQEAMAGKA